MEIRKFIVCCHANMISQGYFDWYGLCPVCDARQLLCTGGREDFVKMKDYECNDCKSILIFVNKYGYVHDYVFDKMFESFEEIEEFCPRAYEICEQVHPEDYYLGTVRIEPRLDLSNTIVAYEMDGGGQGLYDLYMACPKCFTIDVVWDAHTYCEKCELHIHLTENNEFRRPYSHDDAFYNTVLGKSRIITNPKKYLVKLSYKLLEPLSSAYNVYCISPYKVFMNNEQESCHLGVGIS